MVTNLKVDKRPRSCPYLTLVLVLQTILDGFLTARCPHKKQVSCLEKSAFCILAELGYRATDGVGELTQAEFEAHIANNTLRLAFVGMSNAGKSYRSKVLRNECGFMWYHVDDEILRSLGFGTLEDISLWLGYPNREGYLEREKTYLACEDTHTRVEFLDTGGKNLVFDTTGSVIYLPKTTLEWLRENCLIVNLTVDESAVDTMIRRFYEHPKPVTWGGFFKPMKGEAEKETLERCYPKLLSDRLKKYRTLSHIDAPAEMLRDKSGNETLDAIKKHLPV